MKPNDESEEFTIPLDQSQFIKISRQLFLGIAAGLVIISGCAMIMLMKFDFETLFTGDNLAVKVGETSITFEDFLEIKKLAGPESSKISDAAFAAELMDTLFFAEAGRQLKFDRLPSYRENVKVFDKAIAVSSGSIDLSRALFLLEELAHMTREGLNASVVEPQPDELRDASSSEELSPSPDRLRLRTITVSDEKSASEVLRLAATGIPFEELNSSWSKSLYAAVGGDLGWKSAGDFPPEVFNLLASSAIGNLMRGFADESGVHLFRVEEKPQPSATITARLTAGKLLAERRQSAEKRFLQTMRATIPWRLHPSLGGK